MAVETLKQSDYTITTASQLLGFAHSSYYQRKMSQTIEKRMDELQDIQRKLQITRVKRKTA